MRGTTERRSFAGPVPQLPGARLQYQAGMNEGQSVSVSWASGPGSESAPAPGSKAPYAGLRGTVAGPCLPARGVAQTKDAPGGGARGWSSGQKACGGVRLGRLAPLPAGT